MTVERLANYSPTRFRWPACIPVTGLVFSWPRFKREHGQQTVDALIREFGLEIIFDFAPGTKFKGD